MTNSWVVHLKANSAISHVPFSSFPLDTIQKWWLEQSFCTMKWKQNIWKWWSDETKGAWVSVTQCHCAASTAVEEEFTTIFLEKKKILNGLETTDITKKCSNKPPTLSMPNLYSLQYPISTAWERHFIGIQIWWSDKGRRSHYQSKTVPGTVTAP